MKKNPAGWTDEQRKKEYGGRLYADRKEAANDNAPWRGVGEVSKGHHQDLQDSVHRVYPSLRSSRKRNRNHNQLRDGLDSLIDAVSSIPDGPPTYKVRGSGFLGRKKDHEMMAQEFFDSHYGESKEQLRKSATREYHPDQMYAEDSKELYTKVLAIINQELDR